jgi:type VI secretion system protein ImpJ
MKFLSRVVWSEGMHLGPHHFQTQSRYFEDTLWFLHANSRQNPWGFLHYTLDQETIRNGTAILSVASGILPDGLIFDIPDCDSVPVPASLPALFTPTDTAITLFLTIPARRDQGLDTDLGGIDSDTSTRYAAVQRTLRDETLGQDEHNVAFAQKNLALCSQAQLAPGAISFAVARILRDGKGGFVCDAEFIPPCLRIGASERLVLLLHRLLEAIEDKVATVRRDKRSSGRMELGTSALDVANYWFLHCLCSAIPALRHHLSTRLSHPEEVYRDLARLGGALSTFALQASTDEVPRYNHEDLTSTFRDLDALIRRFLEIVVPSNSVTLDFQRAEPYVFTATVKDERCLRRARWIFGIRSSGPEALGESTLLRQVPRLIKICSARGVATLVRRALPGLELLHLPVPPSALSAQADMHYFSISLDGACWQDILQNRLVGVYMPGEFGDAIFELTVITETNA